MPVGTGVVGEGVARGAWLGSLRDQVVGTGAKAASTPSGPAFVQSKQHFVTSGTNTITPTAAPTSGNLAFIAGFSITNALTPPAGWTQIYLQETCCGGEQDVVSVWYHVIGAGETSYTFTGGASDIQLFYVEYSGTTHTPVSGDVIVNQYVNVTSGTVYTSAPTAANRLFFAFVVSDNPFLSVGASVYTHTSAVARRFTDTVSQDGAFADTGIITASPITGKWTFTTVGNVSGVVVQVY